MAEDDDGDDDEDMMMKWCDDEMLEVEMVVAELEWLVPCLSGVVSGLVWVTDWGNE